MKEIPAGTDPIAAGGSESGELMAWEHDRLARRPCPSVTEKKLGRRSERLRP